MTWLARLLRGIVGDVVVIAWTFLVSVIVISIGALGFKRGADAAAVVWARFVLRIFNVEVVFHGLENIQPDRGVLFVFNHQSHFDIPILFCIPKRVRFGAKVELFRIPFFGRAMRALGTLPIARENRGEVFRVYKEAEVTFAGNVSVVLAPEGTRQSIAEIGVFKKGPFTFAINAKAAVAPVVLSGALDVLPKGSFLPAMRTWRPRVHVRFLPVIETEGIPSEGALDLMQATREKMIRAYAELKEVGVRI